MRDIALRGGPVTAVGALDFEETAGGCIPRRLPAWTRPQLDPFTELMARLPSGVRLEFVTDSTAIELDVRVAPFHAGGRPARPAVFELDVASAAAAKPVQSPQSRLARPAVFELDVASAEAPRPVVASEIGDYVIDLQTREVSCVLGARQTLRFDGLVGGIKRCRIWLPHNALVELCALRVDDGALAEPLMFPRARWVHYGSSISHCAEADVPTGTWPAVASRLANVELINLGLGGSCHLDQYAARTMRDIRADLYSIKAGINIVNMDSMKERVFVPALHGFIDTLREAHPTTPIVLVSPIICPAAEDRPGPTVPDGEGRYTTVSIEPEIRFGSLTLRRMRELMAAVVNHRRASGDENLHYVDGLALFGAGDVADLPDHLHPNPAGYRRMGERFYEAVLSDGGLGLGR